MKQSMATITESFAAIFEENNNNLLNSLRTGTFGRVVEINKTTRKVSVQPIIREKLTTKEGYKYIALPELRNIPFISGQYPKVGDYVLCVHSDKSLSNFDINLEKEGYVDANNNRHALTDCVAIVLNTEDEWRLLGKMTTLGQTVDITGKGYTQIKLVLTYLGYQMTSDVYELSETNQYRVIVNDGTIRFGDILLSDDGNVLTYSVGDNIDSIIVYAK